MNFWSIIIVLFMLMFSSSRNTLECCLESSNCDIKNRYIFTSFMSLKEFLILNNFFYPRN